MEILNNLLILFQEVVFQIVALESSPKWRGQGEVIKKATI
jgi:hypothetical protein